MHYLYLDESGDLGDYVDSPGSSRYLVITVLEVTSDKDRKAIEKAVERTVKNKIWKGRSQEKSRVHELKATNTKSLRLQLEAQIPPHVPLFIGHRDSIQTRPLQAVDLFAWGIFRKYELGDTEWYEVFREKIASEKMYPEK